ncbi:hypothetical protein [Natrarchaeobaculum sulfurireducens]|uniref:Uncharacterized protein n=1 Tax=Natrarchaeobaculum sulfurireducens TaxID=2044521 RepID=A0A346PBZ9_9EURY|nr:hypothetical protein [Natrarchaeobaculum sulfurireducens]AXR77044.1 hypothetical protein AArc1_0701 [Natrarchaeobaculum sulfurireducens]
MGSRRDAALAVIVLAVAVVAVVFVEASLSIAAGVAGGVGTLVFEAVATRERALVRRYWDRSLVQAAAIAFSLVGIAVGALVAPSIVLSFVIGALVAYLGFLFVVTFVG